MFAADHGNVGGYSGQNSAITEIKNTTLDPLYITERYASTDLGSFGYEFSVVNGNYIVLLHLAETWWGATGGPANTNKAGMRVMNVDIEGQRRLSNYDIIADVGTMTAVTKRFNTTVNDGSLSMRFTASVNKPKCSAIEIVPAPTPFAGVIPIPGKIEAENFDLGGETSAYHDTNVTNDGGQYRPQEGVDIGAVTDTGGGYSIGWTKASEWLGYTVNVAAAGTYTLQVRVASEGQGGTFHVEFEGVNKTGTITVPNTGGWQNWQTITINNVQLAAGQQTMKVVMDTESSATGAIGNINWLNFTSNSPTTTTTTTAPATTTTTQTGSTTTTTASTTTTTAPGSAGPKLRWAPPALTNPTTINLGAGPTYNKLDNTKDYIINFPNQKKNGITHLDGGRNIRIIGGYGTAVPGDSERVIYLQNQQGIVHLEGLLLDNSGGREADAIAIQAPNATVQIQNVRAVNLVGGQNGHNHSDAVQPWGGVKELRIDRMSASSNYQGLFLRYDLGPIGSATIQNTNLWYQSVSGGVNDGGYMLWLGDCNTVYPTTLSEVYIVTRSGLSLGKSVWPDSDNGSCPVRVTNGRGTWPNLPKISGSVIQGTPPGGDFVPAGRAGLNYVSPGYQ